MTRIRVDLQAISTTTTLSSQAQNEMQDQLKTNLERHHDTLAAQVDHRIDKVEELLRAQSAHLQANQNNQLGPRYGSRASYNKQRRQREREKPQEKGSRSVGIRVTQYASCRPGCPCNCHLQTRSATLPSIFDRVVGQMFVGYAGLPLLNQKCNLGSCQKMQSPSVSFEYWFPLGFVWSQIVRLQLSYQANVGPQFELSSLRRIPDSAPCVNFALNGNIDGLKDLFKRGLASPRDVSSTRGYSVLRVSDESYIMRREYPTTNNASPVGNVRQAIPDLQIPSQCWSGS